MFEYKIVRLHLTGDMSVDDMNGYGTEGWELVLIYPDGNYKIFYFKRKK